MNTLENLVLATKKIVDEGVNKRNETEIILDEIAIVLRNENIPISDFRFFDEEIYSIFEKISLTEYIKSKQYEFAKAIFESDIYIKPDADGSFLGVEDFSKRYVAPAPEEEKGYLLISDYSIDCLINESVDGAERIDDAVYIQATSSENAVNQYIDILFDTEPEGAIREQIFTAFWEATQYGAIYEIDLFNKNEEIINFSEELLEKYGEDEESDDFLKERFKYEKIFFELLADKRKAYQYAMKYKVAAIKCNTLEEYTKSKVKEQTIQTNQTGITAMILNFLMELIRKDDTKKSYCIGRKSLKAAGVAEIKIDQIIRHIKNDRDYTYLLFEGAGGFSSISLVSSAYYDGEEEEYHFSPSEFFSKLALTNYHFGLMEDGVCLSEKCNNIPIKTKAIPEYLKEYLVRD